MHNKEPCQVIALSEIEHLKVHGRTTGDLSPLTLFWTGSAIECNAKGSELWVEVEAAYDHYEPWISIVINSAAVSRQMVTAGRRWVCVFRGMNGGTVKNVRIVKDSQAMSGDPGCALRIHAVKFDGAFLPVAPHAYKMEFIGDSVTAGEGAIGAKFEEDWVPMWMSAIHNYAALTAEALNADYRLIAQSGWGVLTGWDNNPHANIPAAYEQVCGVLTGETNAAFGACQENDFGAWQPDVVVVNLGTNDASAFHTPAWVDGSSGKAHKQRLNDDGSYNEADLAVFEQAVRSFLVKLRTCNKRAHLVWAYGMLGSPLMPSIRRAVDAYRKESGDRNVSVFHLPNTTDESVGSRRHPGRLAHEQAAEALSGYLKGRLG